MPGIHEEVSRSRHVKASSNRRFGWLFATVFLIVARWSLVSGGTLRWWSLIIGVPILLISVAARALLGVTNRLWLRFALLVKRIIGPAVLARFSYVVVSPMGMLMRVYGRDALRLRRNDSDGSYWIRRDPPGLEPDSLHNLF
jgi:hypothetical protein